MVKPLLLVPILANIFYLVSTGRAPVSASSAAFSSASSSGSFSQSYASANAGTNQHAQEEQASSKAVACSNSASSSTGGHRPPPCNSPPSCPINEVWSNCPIAVCSPKTCDDVGFPVPCPDLKPDGHCPVDPGCICREDYVRNFAGICVPMTDCQTCGGDPNAESGCGTNCNRLCSNYNKKPGACVLGCFYNSCECKIGFVFDEIIGKCVFPSECSCMTCTKKHEVYDPCPALCPSRTCGINDAAIRCVPPPFPGDPNCPPPACRCKDGYYRNDCGECVLWEQCPRCRGLNEIYDPCPAPCPPQRCDVNLALILCAVPPKLGDPECKPGCRCIDDHVRNHTGVCIPKDQCPTCPNPNEVFDPCIAPCPPRRCDVDVRLIKCAPPPELGDPLCVAGCRCADGYYKNDLGVCVTKEECPPICGPNEFYSNCIQGNCSPQNCSQLGFPIPCRRIDPKYCIKGCLCKEGYVRSHDGECIPSNRCPSCGGDPHAKPGCGNNCGRLCSNYKQKDVVCTLECQINGCDCIKGYVRDKNINKCVLPKDCSPVCGNDEVYTDCVNSPCPVQNCSLVGITVNCTKIDPKHCIKGCVCKDPFYLREDKGLCIPISECKTPVCKKNEVYSECINGGCTAKNCSQIGFPIPCVKLDPKYCIKGCLCMEGYLREKNGECVPAKDCEHKCNKPNEYYEPCDYDCPPRTCESLDRVYICPIREGDICKAQCKCKEGFYRNINGDCITEKQCRMCMNPHEFFGCGSACDTVCKDLNKKCPIVNIKCTERCYCEKGYARAKNDTCIPIEKCHEHQCEKHERYEKCPAWLCEPQKCSELGYPIPCPEVPDGCKCPVKPACVCVDGYVRGPKGKCIPKKHCPPVCKKNEVYSECINGGCTAKNCSQIGFPIPCVKLDPKYCIKGCLCMEGYLREKNGECVPAKDCEHKCNKPNEYYEPCDYDCPPRTCESLDRVYICPIREGDICKAQCKCKEGFYRNINGDCITEKQCRMCMNPHEFFGCGSACDTVCKDLNKKCPIVNIKCTERCYCEKGYARAKNDTCIPIEKCHEHQCEKHERYEKCPAWLCEPQKCSELGYPIPCPEVPDGCKCPVKPACVCVDGYVRGPKGKCIPKKHCPSCGGDPNAESGCGVNCEKKCEDLGKEPGPCIDVCHVNACDCKDGYYHDKKLDKCVLPSQCTKICSGKHEVFENCSNPSCRAHKCSDLGFPLNCTDPPKCYKGCVCKNGYVRAPNGNCIPVKHCPSCGGDKNAESGCGVNCLKKCYDLQNPNSPRPCPRICKVNSCDCKPGYYFDENTNTCGLPEECTEICSGKHEVFEDCSNPSCRAHKCSDLGFPLNCTDPPKCYKGCVCKNGYVRAPNGNCIPVKHCPSCGGDKNAESGCGVNCLKKCYDLQNPNSPRPCPKICKVNSCDCKPGYYFDENTNTCGLAEECTPICNKNEVHDPCINGGCSIRNCSQLGQPKICIRPKRCKAGCTCKKGYLRDDDTGVCVPEEKCPNVCNKPNEEYVKCPPNCPPQTCESINKTYHCPLIKTKIDESDCTGECRCTKGHYRNLNGECIRKKDCLKCTGDHEYFSCGPVCDNVCCDLDTQSKDNCPIKNIKCVPKCYCVNGYARIEGADSECVPIEDCPGRICKKNEEYDSCVNGGCARRNCSQLNEPILCIDPIKCKGGCTCKKGYLRDEDTGVCVPEEKCPNVCNKPNEEYVRCPPNCPPQTCESINKTYHCPLIKTKIDESDCTGECRCTKGHYRNLNGECIRKKDCLKCTGDHEYFSCGPVCDNVCCDLDTQSKDNCPIKNIKCVPKCYCVNGYARVEGADSECVPIEDCPGRGNPTPKPTVNSTEAISNFEEGNARLNFAFLRQLLDSRPGENIMFSTYSLMNVLAPLVPQSEGDSLDQLLDLLNLDNKEEVQTVFYILINRLKDQQDVIFKSANKIYGTDLAPFTDSFINNAEIFDAEVENIDFTGNPTDVINKWVKEQTNDLIKDIAKPDMFSALTRMAIFNCMYFRGNWVHQFNPKSTQLKDFYINGKDTVSLPTMYLKAKLKYALIEELNAQVLSLPYKGNKFSLLIILPGEDTDLNSVAEKLDPDTIGLIDECLKEVDVIANIPRIDFNCDIPEMKELLIENNFTAPLKPNYDFNGIFKNNKEQLFISDIVQKSAFKMDETGTEAATSSGAIISTRSQALPSPYIFNANRPFILILKYLDSILFCGAFLR